MTKSPINITRRVHLLFFREPDFTCMSFTLLRPDTILYVSISGREYRRRINAISIFILYPLLDNVEAEMNVRNVFCHGHDRDFPFIGFIYIFE